MAHGRSDDQVIGSTHNTARFFTENRHVAWVLLLGTLLWGVFAYGKMPKRKDPEIPVRIAVALCPWPGVTAVKVEQLVTRRIEEQIAENAHVKTVTSVTRNGLGVVYVELVEAVKETGKEFDDIGLRLGAIRDLPQGAGPIDFIKDFGDTAALMLTVASPKVSEIEIELRARTIAQAIARTRAQAPPEARESRASVVACFPVSVSSRAVERARDLMSADAERRGLARDLRSFQGPGYVGLDGVMTQDDGRVLAFIDYFIRERLRSSEIHPDVWRPTVIRDPAATAARLKSVAGDKYSYRELDDLTSLMMRTLHTLPEVAKVSVSGVRPERVYLEYSQERLAAYGMKGPLLEDTLGARNITAPGGVLEVGGKSLNIDPSGEFKSEREIGDVIVASADGGTPVYLRDLVDISREYEGPPRYLNFYSWRDTGGAWQRSRAVTLAVQMRGGGQIARFGAAVDRALGELRRRLPDDLVVARTSDQAVQVEENIHLFMTSLYEAIALVILVALVGFWEWRSALLMAISIPVTLCMTYGFMNALGIDLQQVSIASLIIALGLLVDDPVVAGDAIKRELAHGHPPVIAAWLGPTKLATAILFATLTNIVAYLPLLTLSGDTGRFLYSLPVVLTCSLVASRLVSMTFIPLLGYYLLRPPRRAEPTPHERRSRGFGGAYSRLAGAAIDHRKKVLLGSLLFLLLLPLAAALVDTQFFPKDLSHLAYIDVWLPQDAPFSATLDAARQVDDQAREVAERYGREHPGRDGKPRAVLESVTTFVGGGGPRFWFSVSPELQQLNYAQLILQTRDKHDTGHVVAELQAELSAQVPGARVDVQQLESGASVGAPVALRISGEDLELLRDLAEKAKAVLRSSSKGERVRDDWDEESFVLRLKVDPDRANLAGVSNLDVAMSSATAMTGDQVTTLREGDKQIPVMVRLRAIERAQLSDVQNLYVYSRESRRTVPLSQVSSLGYGLETQRLRRRNQFRTITVSCFPVAGHLPSEVLEDVRPALARLEAELPLGYRLEIGGEAEKQSESFLEMAIVMAISVCAIFLALVLQFRNAVKPLLVFAAIPYGMVGAFVALWLMGAPFGLVAFLGVASLVGVIVSHVIVLFDFIEEAREHGQPLREALLDAGIVRLRPVLITVGATVLGLVPLAAHGGPLWEPLCYAQIGGLTVATFVTLLLVPVLYAFAVLDLKVVKWEAEGGRGAERARESSLPRPAGS